METKIRKWGNSLAIRIPRAFAEELDLTDDSCVELELADDALVIHRRVDATPRLQDLLAQITEENLHTEIDVAGPIGEEAW